jgi:hypothetical protein
MTVYALTVGINAYLPPINALYGCVNDVAAITEVLTTRLGSQLQQLTLLDQQATRAAVIDGWRQHLGQAGSGDVALFYYGGHGGEEPAPPELVNLEGTKRLQNLICFDSGRRVDGKLVRALADKELAALISEVAARGAHVAVLLDCCHSGSGTRDAVATVRQWIGDAATLTGHDRDVAVALAEPRAAIEFIAGSLRPPASPADHVALSACQDFQVAKEISVGGTMRGAFSVALIEALAVLGPASTYRTVLAAIRGRIGRTTSDQDPTLHPVDANGYGDALFCDGAIQPTPPTVFLSAGKGGWWLDAGAVHGIREPAGTEEFRFACYHPVTTAFAGTVRVVAVEPGRSRVEPIDWTPEDTVYRAVVATVPMPRASVVIDAADSADDEAVAKALVAAIASSAPGGGPSAHVVVDVAATAPAVAASQAAVSPAPQGVTLRVRSQSQGEGAPRIRILRADGTPATADAAGTDASAVRTTVARLEHIARWELLRGLGEQRSELASAVELVMYPGQPNEMALPADRAPLVAAEGAHRLQYSMVDGSYAPPWVFIQLRNTSNRPLFVALLDLTDRYQCHAALFATQRIAPAHAVTVFGGRSIPVTLPKGRDVVAGASARDLLKVIVSDTDFDASALELPPLDEPPTRSGSRKAPRNSLERLAGRAITRDFGTVASAPVAVAEWAASTTPVVTAVP